MRLVSILAIFGYLFFPAPGELPLRAAENQPQNNSSLSPQDVDFLLAAAERSVFQMEMGKLAAERALSPEVRQFAAEVLKDSAASRNELEKIAGDGGVQLPRTMDPRHAAEFDRLAKTPGTEFEIDYLKSFVPAQKGIIAEFSAEKEKTQNRALKTWVEKQLILLDGNLQTAGNLLPEAEEGKLKSGL